MRLVAWLCVLLLWPLTAFGQDPLSRVEADRVFLTELTQLAANCDQEGLGDLASQIRGWFIPRGRDRQYLFLGAPQDNQLPAEARREHPQRYDEFQQLRSRQADRLWKLAEQAASEGQLASALQLIYEVLHERPDDERARRSLGLRRPRKPSDQAVAKLARHPQQALGWPAGKYWRLSTDHFSISTNHSGEAAQELATVLEDFYTLWRQLFVDYWTSPAAVRQAVSGRGLPRISSPRHRVVLFRNRPEYVGYLQRIEPQAEMTLGIYRDADRLAYFFAGEEDQDVESTWRHEIAHQLFQETRRPAQSVGEAHNFWFVEGIALYLESLREFTDYHTVGGFDSERLQFARYRALNESFYIPLAELSVLGRVALQQDPRIRRIYSQAAGLTHFLMDGQAGAFRSAASRVLEQIYAGEDRIDSLSQAADLTTAEIDAKYLAFLSVDDQQLQQVRFASDPRQQPRKLCLGHCDITDAGLAGLSGLRRLDWLDLAACPITDAGLGRLSSELPLQQLNLEGSLISNAGLASVSRWQEIQELDLTSTAISDAGLDEIAKLTKLRVLWLTNTRITDTGLEKLSQLKFLERLDVAGTQVTAAAWQKFLAAHPDLNKSS